MKCVKLECLLFCDELKLLLNQQRFYCWMQSAFKRFELFFFKIALNNSVSFV